jgi:thymidylate synthase
MTLNQRSNDYIIAGYINKTQYVALQMMVAGHCGYKPGKFCHLVQNLHIYDKHFDAVSELLRRDNLDIKPRIILKENKNFYDYTINDFEIIDVDIIPKLSMKLEIAI